MLGRASASRSATRAWKIAPNPAIPVAVPTCRNVLLMPDAAPLLRGSTTPIAFEPFSELYGLVASRVKALCDDEE